jgi:hypothetical protein
MIHDRSIAQHRRRRCSSSRGSKLPKGWVRQSSGEDGAAVLYCWIADLLSRINWRCTCRRGQQELAAMSGSNPMIGSMTYAVCIQTSFNSINQMETCQKCSKKMNETNTVLIWANSFDYVAARLDQASISAKRLENILLFGNFKLTLNRNPIAHILWNVLFSKSVCHAGIHSTRSPTYIEFVFFILWCIYWPIFLVVLLLWGHYFSLGKCSAANWQLLPVVMAFVHT